MTDDSTGYLSDLFKILENVNFKGTNFKMPHSILSVAIYNQTGNALGRYSQLSNPFDPDYLEDRVRMKVDRPNRRLVMDRPLFRQFENGTPDTYLIFFDSSLIFSVKVSSSTSSTSTSGLFVG